MADSVKASVEKTPSKPLKRNSKKISFSSVMSDFRAWSYKNRYYLLAFFLPAVLMYLAYVLFKVYPFGDHCVLVLDLNGQYVYFFEALRDAFWGDSSMLYSWSRNLSGNYMGVIGYYLASPFTLIVMLLPRTMILGSIMIMQLAKLGTAGLTFCMYLQKSRGMKPLHSLIFSTCYGVMAYAVIQAMDPMWLDGLVFLPLIMLGVERLIDHKLKVGYIIPLAIMFFANFYIGYMVGIFTFLYFIYYLFFGTEKVKYNAYNIFSTCLRFGLSTIIAVMTAAVMLIPMYLALKLGKFDFSTPDYSLQFEFTALDFLPKLLPSTYDTVRNIGLPEVYCGTITVLMIPLFYLNKNISSRFKVGHTFLLVVMFLSMYIKPIDILWHGCQVPNWLPYRYSFMFSFVILIMAGSAFKNIEGVSKKAISGTFIGIFAYLLLLDKIYPMYKDNYDFDNIDTWGTIWFSIACFAAFTILVSSFREHTKSKALPIVMLLVICGELTVDAFQTFKDIDKDVVYSKRSSYYDYINNNRDIVDEIEKMDKGLYRSDKTYSRTTNDALALGLKGVTHSNSVMNTKILNFIGALGYNQRTYYTRYSGATPLADSLLGFKYVLDKQGNGAVAKGFGVSSTYNPVFTYNYKENDIDTNVVVYQNPNALQVGYMVDDSVLSLGAFTSKNPFENQNKLMSAMIGQYDAGAMTMVPFYKEIPQTAAPVLTNVSTSAYGQDTKYTAGSGDPTVDFFFTATTDDPVYMYFPTTSEKQVNMWINTTKDEATGGFSQDSKDFEYLGQYFETQYYAVMNLGTFKPGTEVDLRMTIKDSYTILSNSYIYYLDMDAYQSGIDSLKQNQLNIEKWSDTKIKGTIDAKDGQIMMTSIPYEKGWTVKVDGKKAKLVSVCDGLMGVRMNGGHHTIKMTYIPDGLIPGVILMIIGIACIVFIYRYDKKTNKFYIEKLKANTTE